MFCWMIFFTPDKASTVNNSRCFFFSLFVGGWRADRLCWGKRIIGGCRVVKLLSFVYLRTNEFVFALDWIRMYLPCLIVCHCLNWQFECKTEMIGVLKMCCELHSAVYAWTGDMELYDGISDAKFTTVGTWTIASSQNICFKNVKC